MLGETVCVTETAAATNRERNALNRLEKSRIRKQKRHAKRNGKGHRMADPKFLTETQKVLSERIMALNEEVLKLRVTPPTGHRIANAFNELATVLDEACKEINAAEKGVKPGLRDVTNEVAPETLAAAGVEPKEEPPAVN